MVTIYYPYFDLENRKLIPPVSDHVLNIKLLLLIADRVLILTSHLLDTNYKKLSEIISGLHSYVIDGEVVFPIYEGQTNIDDYLNHKIYKAESLTKFCKYKVNAELLRSQLFDGKPEIINVNNSDERKRFQMIYTETNIEKALETGKKSLIKSAQVFQNELFMQKEKVGTYLTLFEVNALLEQLITEKKIRKSHQNFFIRNQISSYYYCGSVAHSAFVAYNPYFEDIHFDETTESIDFHTTTVYSPGFLLNVLIGLKVIRNAEDISLLSKESMDQIRKDKAWEEFKVTFDKLNRNAQSLDLILYREYNVEKKIEKIKKFVFYIVSGITSTAISVVIEQLIAGYVLLAVSTVVNILMNVVNDGQVIKKLRAATSDEIINRLYASKEPFYVITERIKSAVEKSLE